MAESLFIRADEVIRLLGVSKSEAYRIIKRLNHFAADVKKKRNRLTAAQNRLNELEVLLCKIYEDNILGKLPDARYATLDAQYGKEQAELKAEVVSLEAFLQSHEASKKSAERFISLIEKYENFDNLTIAIFFGRKSWMRINAFFSTGKKNPVIF